MQEEEAQCVLKAAANENTGAGGEAAGVHSRRPMNTLMRRNWSCKEIWLRKNMHPLYCLNFAEPYLLQK